MVGAAPIDADQDHVGLRQVQPACAVGDDVHRHEAQRPGLEDDVAQPAGAVAPEEGLPAIEEQDPHALATQGVHVGADAQPGVVHPADVGDRAVLAVQVAPVGEDDRADDRVGALPHDGVQAEPPQLGPHPHRQPGHHDGRSDGLPAVRSARMAR